MYESMNSFYFCETTLDDNFGRRFNKSKEKLNSSML